MVIRSEQIKDMQARTHEEYIERLARHVTSHFPSELARRGLEGPKLKVALRMAVSDARGYDVQDAADLELYADCIALLGPQFDTDPFSAWAGAILRRQDLNGTAKMDQISEHLLFGSEGPR
jgi:hypothetical protein